MKIVFSTHEFWPGVYSCLKNILSVFSEKIPSAEVSFFKLSQKGVSFDLVKKLKMDVPDFLILGGWDNNIKMVAQNADKGKTKIILMWCSPACQIDLGGEIPRFMEVIECVKSGLIDYVALPYEKDYEILSKVYDKFLYFPIYMDLSELESNRTRFPQKEESIIDVDIFCGPCPRKNIFAQMISILPFKNKIRLNVNYHDGIAGKPYIQTASMFDLKIVNHPWLSREDYLKKIQSMDIGMQVTISESFNYVAAEHIYYGIPVLCSSALPYIKKYKELAPITVFNQEDVGEIHEKFEHLIKEKNMINDIMGIAKQKLIEFNQENKDILVHSITGALSR